VSKRRKQADKRWPLANQELLALAISRFQGVNALKSLYGKRQQLFF
jgi:hypothetical protein